MSNEQKPRPEGLIKHLLTLVDKDERGTLATLRHGLGRTPGTHIESFPDIIPYIPEELPQAQRWPYHLVAALFASSYKHTHNTEEGNFGRTMRVTASNPSAELRFRGLLNAHVEDLPRHLRQVMSLVASKGGYVHWSQLLRDLRHWDHPSRFVQQSWAREYWRQPPTETTESSPAV